MTTGGHAGSGASWELSPASISSIGVIPAIVSLEKGKP